MLEPKSKDELKIVVISDGTGETASLMTKAAMVQFSTRKVYFSRYKNIRTQAQIEAIFEDSKNSADLFVYTIVSPELRRFINEESEKMNMPVIDLLGPLLNTMALFFEEEPIEQPGIFHQVNDQYFRRIAAMEYTIKHDDGSNLTNLDKSDLIILGISRTSKTPLSMYLSHHGWRVCNVPIVKGIPIPKEIFVADQKKIIGLTIQANVLQEIRKVRLNKLGGESLNQDDSYARLDHIVDDIEYANQVFRENKRWPVFDVSGKALEETAAEIMKLMETRKKLAKQKTNG